MTEAQKTLIQESINTANTAIAERNRLMVIKNTLVRDGFPRVNHLGDVSTLQTLDNQIQALQTQIDEELSFAEYLSTAY